MSESLIKRVLTASDFSQIGQVMSGSDVARKRTKTTELQTFIESDLTITIGREKNGGGTTGTIYKYPAAVMAAQSTEIDQKLAELKKAGQGKPLELKFPSIDKDTWDNMMRLLKPTEARTISVDDAIECAPWYATYGFDEGKALCDQVLSLFLASVQDPNKYEDKKVDVDKVVQIMALASGNILEGTKEEAVELMNSLISDRYDVGFEEFGITSFTVEHVRKLQPLLVDMFNNENSFVYRLSPLNDMDSNHLKSDLFPRLFVSEWNSFHAKQMMNEQINVEIEYGTRKVWLALDEGEWLNEGGAKIELNGKCYSPRIDQDEDENWVIIGYRYDHVGGSAIHTLWKSYAPSNSPLPPKQKWISCHHLTESKPAPTIRYIWDD